MTPDTPSQSATRDGPTRPRLKLASAVMFVVSLDRSVPFYEELLGLEATVRNESAALLVSPDGYQLYLREMGKRTHHWLGSVGIQYLVWTAENERDLQRCEQVMRKQSPNVTSQKIDGFTMLEGRGPDDVPVVVTYPGPVQAPRHDILDRIYRW
ncbi:VOC family protein [Arthrobacter monumenti]